MLTVTVVLSHRIVIGKQRWGVGESLLPMGLKPCRDYREIRIPKEIPGTTILVTTQENTKVQTDELPQI
jgi:hypothetical protein